MNTDGLVISVTRDVETTNVHETASTEADIRDETHTHVALRGEELTAPSTAARQCEEVGT